MAAPECARHWCVVWGLGDPELPDKRNTPIACFVAFVFLLSEQAFCRYATDTGTSRS